MSETDPRPFPTPEESRLSLRLANTMDAVEQCRNEIMSFLAPFRLGDSMTNRIEVILEELVSNVVRHGIDVSELLVEASCDKGDVLLLVEDDGAPFNPLDRPDPPPFTTLEEARLGGLGIPLLRRLTKSACYERIKAGSSEHNRIIAVFSA